MNSEIQSRLNDSTSYATWIDEEEVVANFSRFTIPLIRRNYPSITENRSLNSPFYVDQFYKEYGLEKEEEVNWIKEGF